VQPVLDAVEYYLPSPLDVPPVEGESVADKKKAPSKLKRAADAEEPFCGLVFKVLPAKTGDVHWVRVQRFRPLDAARAQNFFLLGSPTLAGDRLTRKIDDRIGTVDGALPLAAGTRLPGQPLFLCHANFCRWSTAKQD
jgi:hypothetical protein